ncbi:MAG: hypothetical protein K6C94_00155 [Candidatus Gastranaerophilales bacterium]|nr:hypothetical protein [Candidatus Gastranaerophilales bacterium]
MNIFLILSTLITLYLITLFCEFFTNAIEHLGNYFKIQDGALGSIFAAIGTAFPETVLPLIAIFGAYLSGSDIQMGKEIGKGAVLGSPFMLSTLAFFLVALWIIILSVRKKRTSLVNINVKFFRRDLIFFLTAYSIGVACSFCPADYGFIKIIIGIFLLGFYLFYAIRTVKKNCCTDGFCENECEELKILKIFKNAENIKVYLIFAQLILSALALMVSAEIFVENIKEISQIFNINALIISLFISPVATELPETVNGLVWSTNKKDTLAVSNITGAMVFQACIPMAIAVLFTDWTLGAKELFNIICVYVSVAILFFAARKNSDEFPAKYLILCIIPYLSYLFYICCKIFR